MLLEHNIPVYNKLEEMMKTNGKALVVTTTGTGKSYLGLEYAEQHNLFDDQNTLMAKLYIAKESENKV